MRIYLLYSLLAVAVTARPQTNTTSEPIEHPQQIQNHRYTNQSRGISRRASTFIPIDHITPASNRVTSKHNTTRRKTGVKYKISPVTSLKPHANQSALTEHEKIHKFIVLNIDNLNRTKVKLPPVKANKHWPDSAINSAADLSNYNNYIRTTTSRPKKPLVQNIVTRVAPNPVKNKHSGWQQIQMKPTPAANYISAQGSLPINVIQNSNPFPVHLPPSHVQFETLVTLAPEQPLKGTNVANPCPVVTVTSNTIYNKELCPDLDIVINNHIQTNTNIFTESPLAVAEDDDSVDYAANASDYESVEVPPDQVAPDQAAADETLEEEPSEVASELGEVSILADQEALPAEDGLGESVASSGTETEPASSASQSGNRPQLPNLPQLPQNDNSDDDDDDDDGIFDGGLSLPNPLDYPFISFVLFPLAVLLTGTLGLTFFLPWTIFPTIFLSRKAKQAHLNEPIVRPDGWFWHERYQSWANVHRHAETVVENRRAFPDNGYILRLIEEFGRKYSETTSKSWKRRKKN